MAFILNESFSSGSNPGGGWSGASTGDFGYATAPAPLEGSYSLHVGASDTFGGLFDHGSDVTGEQWGHFLLNVHAFSGAFITILLTYNGAFAANPLELLIFADGTVGFTDSNGAHNAITASSISVDTTYHVWWRYKPGSGSNSEKELWINTTNDRAGTVSGFHASNTAGAMTGGIQYFILKGTDGVGTADYIVDTVQWSDADAFTGGGGGGALPVGMSSGFMD